MTTIAPVSAKCCPKCRKQGRCADSRPQGAYVRRRYHCKCGHRWTTAEFLVKEGNGSKDEVKRFMENQALRHVKQMLEPLRGLLEDTET